MKKIIKLSILLFLGSMINLNAQVPGTPYIWKKVSLYNPAALVAGAGTLTGKTCFDIALSNDNINGCGVLSSRLSQQADFTQSSTYTQTYTFTPTGTVSNVRFYYVNTNGNVIQSLSGGNSGNSISSAVNATVSYFQDLNTTAFGTTGTTALKADIYAVYNINAANNNNPADDRSVKLTTQVKDCACCGAYGFTSTANFQPSTNAKTWLTFMCHNLGANTSLNPFVYVSTSDTTDNDIKGYIYQWGRQTDGHEARSSATTFTLATNNTATLPVGVIGKYILQNVSPFDWRSGGGNLTRWGSGANSTNMSVPKTVNDPCPAGYKVPSHLQWGSIFRGGETTGTYASNTATANTWTWTGNGYMVGNLLYLPAGGMRNGTIGVFNIPAGIGAGGGYWSSSTYVAGGATNAYALRFSSGGVATNSLTAIIHGASVRCIAE